MSSLTLLSMPPCILAQSSGGWSSRRPSASSLKSWQFFCQMGSALRATCQSTAGGLLPACAALRMTISGVSSMSRRYVIISSFIICQPPRSSGSRVEKLLQSPPPRGRRGLVLMSCCRHLLKSVDVAATSRPRIQHLLSCLYAFHHAISSCPATAHALGKGDLHTHIFKPSINS